MIRVSQHDHIVNFQGISVQENQVYLLLEYCSFGPIDTYLQNYSEHYTFKLEHGSFKEIINWCIQVAKALEFLVKNNIIHVRKRKRKLRKIIKFSEMNINFLLF